MDDGLASVRCLRKPPNIGPDTDHRHDAGHRRPRPDPIPLPRVPRTGRETREFRRKRDARRRHEAQGLRIDVQTAATHWRGERMDYGMEIDSLLMRARREQDVPAGRS